LLTIPLRQIICGSDVDGEVCSIVDGNNNGDTGDDGGGDDGGGGGGGGYLHRPP